MHFGDRRVKGSHTFFAESMSHNFFVSSTGLHCIPVFDVFPEDRSRILELPDLITCAHGSLRGSAFSRFRKAEDHLSCYRNEIVCTKSLHLAPTSLINVAGLSCDLPFAMHSSIASPSESHSSLTLTTLCANKTPHPIAA